MKIKHFILLIIASFLITLESVAATINANANGNWNAGTTWAGGIVPGPTDITTASAAKNLTVISTDNLTAVSFTPGANGSLTIDAGGNLTFNNPGLIGLSIGANYTLVVNGTLTINGNLNVSNLLNLTVNGSIIVNGNIVLGNSATMNVGGSGSITVTGDFTAGNSVSVDIDLGGAVDVGGTVTVGNSGSLTGDGTFTAGDCGGASPGFCSALPVKLLFFKGDQLNLLVRLEWATYEQENFDFFCIERSFNGTEFNCISEIVAKEWSNNIVSYSFDDLQPIPGNSYYRLKAVDLDGSFERFSIIRVNFDGVQKSFSVYPNPVSNDEFTVFLNYLPDVKSKYYLFNLQGRVVEEQYFSSYKATISTSGLRSGIYYIRVSDKNGISASQKLMVR